MIIKQEVSDHKCAGCGKKEDKLLCLHCVRSNFVFRNRVSEKSEIKEDELDLRDSRTFRSRKRELEGNEENNQKRNRRK